MTVPEGMLVVIEPAADIAPRADPYLSFDPDGEFQ